MTETSKVQERMKEHNINSLDELAHCLRVHDAAFVNDLAADAIEALQADITNAMSYIPHICTTCKYWRAVSYTHECAHPNPRTPCYVWFPQNWEWDGQSHKTTN